VASVDEKSLDNVSAITSETAGAASAADQPAAATADDDDDEVSASVTTSAGNLDIVLRVLSGMCDGQYTDLQASAMGFLCYFTPG